MSIGYNKSKNNYNYADGYNDAVAQTIYPQRREITSLSQQNNILFEAEGAASLVICMDSLQKDLTKLDRSTGRRGLYARNQALKEESV